MRTLRDQACLVGVGHTEYSKDSGRSEMELACESIRAAMDDAGIAPDDLDGIAKYSWDNNDPVLIAKNLGLPRLNFFGEVAYGDRDTIKTGGRQLPNDDLENRHLTDRNQRLGKRNGIRLESPSSATCKNNSAH